MFKELEINLQDFESKHDFFTPVPLFNSYASYSVSLSDTGNFVFYTWCVLNICEGKLCLE
jgi:hypothetical protein